MNYHEKEVQRRKQDQDFNRSLIWVGVFLVIEFLLVLVNRTYINYQLTTESVNLATTVHSVLQYGRWVMLAVAVGCAVWAIFLWRQKKAMGLQMSVTIVFAVLFACIQIVLAFQDAGIQMLFWMVPACAGLALVYYLYQREFFVCALVSSCGIMGLWFIRNAGARSYWVALCAAGIVLIAGAIFFLNRNGAAAVETQKDTHQESSNYMLMWLSCVVSVVVMGLSILVGATVAYYLIYAMIAWLFALLVYYTVKMM